MNIKKCMNIKKAYEYKKVHYIKWFLKNVHNIKSSLC